MFWSDPPKSLSSSSSPAPHLHPLLHSFLFNPEFTFLCTSGICVTLSVEPPIRAWAHEIPRSAVCGMAPPPWLTVKRSWLWCSQDQDAKLLWVHDCHSQAAHRRWYLVAPLPILWLLDSFWPLFIMVSDINALPREEYSLFLASYSATSIFIFLCSPQGLNQAFV